MPTTNPDQCRTCEAELPLGFASCQRCGTPRNSTWAIMLAEHIIALMDEGVVDTLEMLARLQDSGRYLVQFTPQYVAQQMRLVTRDTTQLARQLAKARAARTMLEVLETGDTKDKIQVMRGIQVLGDVVEHKGEVTTRFVVETHEGPPPRQEG